MRLRPILIPRVWTYFKTHLYSLFDIRRHGARGQTWWIPSVAMGR